MAAGKCRAIPTAPMMAMVVAVLMAAAVVAVSGAIEKSKSHSFLTTWSAAGCTGDTSTIQHCGCGGLEYSAGQVFYYRGDSATLYTEDACAGTPYQVSEDTQAWCADYGWRSIYIDC